MRLGGAGIATGLGLVVVLGATGSGAGEGTGNGRIAFVRNADNGETDVASIKPSGRGRLNLTRSEPNEQYVDVSPDGRWVAFARFGRNGGEIYKVPSAG
ncbi:MAG TPA: hypothetical protein VJ927_09195, partial [Actinomycetota bacterium]|nr:hypothetical protein [Actinomycetota bacterium]